MDYLNHWSLRHRPFMEQPFFHGEPQREAIAGIVYFVACESRLAHIIAQPACGTSRLLHHVALMQGLGDCAVDIIRSNAASWDGCNIEAYLNVAFGLPAEFDFDDTRRMLQSNLRRGLRNVWMIDDVSTELEPAIRAWTGSCDEVAVVMARRVSRLLMNHRCEYQRIDLHPLALEDTLRYVEHALRHAGAPPSLFTDAAAVRLHELGDGRIGEMALIAERSLITAAAKGQRRVDRENIDETRAAA